jgi:hypothetical protein
MLPSRRGPNIECSKLDVTSVGSEEVDQIAQSKPRKQEKLVDPADIDNKRISTMLVMEESSEMALNKRNVVAVRSKKTQDFTGQDGTSHNDRGDENVKSLTELTVSNPNYGSSMVEDLKQ